MSDETHTFASTRARLDEIVQQVRKKETSLEKSLDLLEEGVRLANQCTELIDHADWEPDTGSGDEDASGGDTGDASDEGAASETSSSEETPKDEAGQEADAGGSPDAG